MGLFDIFSSASRKKREAAIAAGLQTGLFQQCPVCREITEKQAPDALLKETEHLASAWIDNDDDRAKAFGGDIEAFKTEIRKLKKSAPFNCVCERI